MSIDNLPSTKLGGIRLRNLSHYNTDDLLAIIDAVQASTPDADYTWSYSVEQSCVEGLDKVIEVREFTGQPRVSKKYQGNSVVYSRRSFLAPSRWRDPMTFRVMPPEKLHESPIQTLTEATSDNPTVPQYMVEEFAERVRGLWRQRTYKSEPAAMPDVSLMKIRISPSRLKGNKKRAALARKRQLLHGETLRIEYRTEQALRATRAMREHVQKVLKYTVAMGMDASKVQGVLAAVSTALEALEPTEATCKTLAKEAQQMVDAA